MNPLDEISDSELEAEFPDSKSLRLLSKLHDPRFGVVQLFSSNDNLEKVIMKSRTFKSRAELKIAVLKAKGQVKNSHPNVQRVIGYSSAIVKSFCAPSFSIKTYHVYPTRFFEQSVEHKIYAGTQWGAKELLTIQTHLLVGLAFLHNQGLAFGDLRPSNIGEDINDNYFLFDPTLINSTRYDTLADIMKGRKQMFFSPSLYKMLSTGKGKDGRQKDWKDPLFISELQQNDVFALGLMIVWLGTSEKTNGCYQAAGEFDNCALAQLISNFESRYSEENQLLVESVRRMIETRDEYRPSAKQLVGSFVYESLNNITIDRIADLDINFLKNEDQLFQVDLMQVEQRQRETVNLGLSELNVIDQNIYFSKSQTQDQFSQTAQSYPQSLQQTIDPQRIPKDSIVVNHFINQELVNCAASQPQIYQSQNSAFNERQTENGNFQSTRYEDQSIYVSPPIRRPSSLSAKVQRPTHSFSQGTYPVEAFNIPASNKNSFSMNQSQNRNMIDYSQPNGVREPEESPCILVSSQQSTLNNDSKYFKRSDSVAATPQGPTHFAPLSNFAGQPYSGCFYQNNSQFARPSDKPRNSEDRHLINSFTAQNERPSQHFQNSMALRDEGVNVSGSPFPTNMNNENQSEKFWEPIAEPLKASIRASQAPYVNNTFDRRSYVEEQNNFQERNDIIVSSIRDQPINQWPMVQNQRANDQQRPSNFFKEPETIITNNVIIPQGLNQTTIYQSNIQPIPISNSVQMRSRSLQPVYSNNQHMNISPVIHPTVLQPIRASIVSPVIQELRGSVISPVLPQAFNSDLQASQIFPNVTQNGKMTVISQSNFQNKNDLLEKSLYVSSPPTIFHKKSNSSTPLEMNSIPQNSMPASIPQTYSLLASSIPKTIQNQIINRTDSQQAMIPEKGISFENLQSKIQIPNSVPHPAETILMPPQTQGSQYVSQVSIQANSAEVKQNVNETKGNQAFKKFMMGVSLPAENSEKVITQEKPTVVFGERVLKSSIMASEAVNRGAVNSSWINANFPETTPTKQRIIPAVYDENSQPPIVSQITKTPEMIMKNSTRSITAQQLAPSVLTEFASKEDETTSFGQKKNTPATIYPMNPQIIVHKNEASVVSGNRVNQTPYFATNRPASMDPALSRISISNESKNMKFINESEIFSNKDNQNGDLNSEWKNSNIHPPIRNSEYEKRSSLKDSQRDGNLSFGQLSSKKGSIKSFERASVSKLDPIQIDSSAQIQYRSAAISQLNSQTAQMLDRHLLPSGAMNKNRDLRAPSFGHFETNLPAFDQVEASFSQQPSTSSIAQGYQESVRTISGSSLPKKSIYSINIDNIQQRFVEDDRLVNESRNSYANQNVA